jgi:hypothetical protein
MRPSPTIYIHQSGYFIASLPTVAGIYGFLFSVPVLPGNWSRGPTLSTHSFILEASNKIPTQSFVKSPLVSIIHTVSELYIISSNKAMLMVHLPIAVLSDTINHCVVAECEVQRESGSLVTWLHSLSLFWRMFSLRLMSAVSHLCWIRAIKSAWYLCSLASISWIRSVCPMDTLNTRVTVLHFRVQA